MPALPLRFPLCALAALSATLAGGLLFSRAEDTQAGAADVPPDTTLSPGRQAAVEGMTRAAVTLLGALDESQRREAVFPLTDEERLNWNFVPASRKGLSLGSLTPGQTPLVYGLLGTALSAEGLRKTTAIISLEQVLHELENDSPSRDPKRYFITVFGDPRPGSAWGWRFEGHHLSLNFVIAENNAVSVTPSFMGANPGLIADGSRAGLRVLAAEEDTAFALARSLSEEQKTTAILPGTVPSDILTGRDREVKPLLPAGLSSREMTPAQRLLLWELIGEYVNRFRPDLTESVKSSLTRDSDAGTLTFAWSGGTQPGQGHYYRIQSPRFLFEYDNTQNNARHPHTVWRDFNGDFGRDLLLEHYRKNHPGK